METQSAVLLGSYKVGGKFRTPCFPTLDPTTVRQDTP